MAHGGFMGLTAAGYAYLGGFTAFFYFLSRSFSGPEDPKFVFKDPRLVEIAKETQPGLQVEHYIKK